MRWRAAAALAAIVTASAGSPALAAAYAEYDFTVSGNVLLYNPLTGDGSTTGFITKITAFLDSGGIASNGSFIVANGLGASLTGQPASLSFMNYPTPEVLGIGLGFPVPVTSNGGFNPLPASGNILSSVTFTDVYRSGANYRATAASFEMKVSDTPLGPTGVTLTTIYLPEPATWATMVLGIAMIGAALRRSRGRMPRTA